MNEYWFSDAAIDVGTVKRFSAAQMIPWWVSVTSRKREYWFRQHVLVRDAPAPGVVWNRLPLRAMLKLARRKPIPATEEPKR